MSKLSQIFATIAGMIHVLFFIMESLVWMNPDIHAVFQVSNLADAETLRVYVQNQGFYNLFLALGMFAGLGLLSRNKEVGVALVVYASLFMVGAATVLFFTIPAMITGVFIQGLAPLIVLITFAIGRSR